MTNGHLALDAFFQKRTGPFTFLGTAFCGNPHPHPGVMIGKKNRGATTYHVVKSGFDLWKRKQARGEGLCLSDIKALGLSTVKRSDCDRERAIERPSVPGLRARGPWAGAWWALVTEGEAA